MCAALVGITVQGAGHTQASDKLDDACDLFQQKIGWRTITSEASEKWGIPVSVILAIMHQESRFKSTAAAKTSTAFGYSQALDGTWAEYQAEMNTSHAVRTSLSDSADFIGWYMTRTEEKIGLPLDDVAAHYLSYHEGPAGYRSKRWKKQSKLIQISENVAERAKVYEVQLRQCRPSEEGVLVTEVPQPIAKSVALATLSTQLPRRKPSRVLVAMAQLFSDGIRRVSFR